MRLLLEGGAAVNAQAETKMTALMLASHSDNSEAVATLLAHGADPDLRNDKGESAFAFAQSDGVASMLPEEANLEIYLVPATVVGVLVGYVLMSMRARQKREWCKDTMTEIYSKYNKKKLTEVDALMDKFAGNEDELVRIAREKYCAKEGKKTK